MAALAEDMPLSRSVIILFLSFSEMCSLWMKYFNISIHVNKYIHYLKYKYFVMDQVYYN